MLEFMYAWLVVAVGAAACGSPPRKHEPPVSTREHPAGSPDSQDHASHSHDPSQPSHDPTNASHDHANHSHDHSSGHHSFANAEEWAKRFDDPARDEWQRPDDVIRALALSPTSVVADVGAGTGYFTMRIARIVSRGQVIATDIEPDMVRYLAERAGREKLTNVRAVAATPTTSGLSPSSVDVILVVDVWHHIADRVAYARDLAAALRPGGRLFVVDFTLTTHRGPPPAMRLAPEAIIADLAAAGLVAKVSSVALPDQYIVEAQRATR